MRVDFGHDVQRVLSHFRVSPDDYEVIFTSGATDSLRIVAECFQFGDRPTSSCCFRCCPRQCSGVYRSRMDGIRCRSGLRLSARQSYIGCWHARSGRCAMHECELLDMAAVERSTRGRRELSRSTGSRSTFAIRADGDEQLLRVQVSPGCD